MTSSKPKILILGEPKEGTFERELQQFLSTKERYAECQIQPKSSQDLTRAAQESDLIVMFFQSLPEELREQDKKVLPYLRGNSDQLLLFADDRGDLMDIIDDLDMRAYRVFRLTKSDDWQRRLLESILDWKDSQAALQATMSAQTEAAGGAAAKKDKRIPLLSFVADHQKELIAVLAVATTTIAGWLTIRRPAEASQGSEPELAAAPVDVPPGPALVHALYGLAGMKHAGEPVAGVLLPGSSLDCRGIDALLTLHFQGEEPYVREATVRANPPNRPLLELAPPPGDSEASAGSEPSAGQRVAHALDNGPLELHLDAAGRITRVVDAQDGFELLLE